MSKLWKQLLPAGMAAWMVFAGVSVTALAAAKDDTTRFVSGTVINGVEVSAMTVEEAKNHIESYFKGGYSLKIEDENGNKELLRDTDIGYELTVTGDLDAILQWENNSGREAGPGAGNSYRVEVQSSYDEELLKTALGNLWRVKESTPTTDAYISPYEEGKPFTIIPEVQGNELDMDKLLAVVKAALDEQKSSIRIQDYDCYKTIQVTSDDEHLNQLCATMNDYKDVQITYNFGDRQEVLSGTDIVPWILGSDGTEILVDEAKVAEYVAALAAEYDTYGKPIAYRTTSGRDVTVSGTYGWQINQAEETAALVQIIKSCQSQTREPIYSQTAISRTGYDFGNTYVEIDLATQHMYLYENGVCIIDSPFVSGNVSKGWATPDGLYFLTYKERDRVLRGEKLADGSYSYESPVSYWMPFNGGIGMHDASWRGSFGGSIYKTNGSHGCINLPTNVAPTVYAHVYKGMPIICCN